MYRLPVCSLRKHNFGLSWYRIQKNEHFSTFHKQTCTSYKKTWDLLNRLDQIKPGRNCLSLIVMQWVRIISKISGINHCCGYSNQELLGLDIKLLRQPLALRHLLVLHQAFFIQQKEDKWIGKNLVKDLISTGFCVNQITPLTSERHWQILGMILSDFENCAFLSVNMRWWLITQHKKVLY